MRSVCASRVRGALALGALLLLGGAGCSKKVTDPNSRPVPEGRQNNQMLMMGWHEQYSISFSINDPGTPDDPTDDRLGNVFADVWVDTAGVRTTTLDLSLSNQLEAMRVGSDGNVRPLFDFALQPSARLIGSNLDVFGFEDLAPGANPAYYGRGILNGQVTTASPVTNRASAFPLSDLNLNFIPEPKSNPGDSILKIQFQEDPRESFYIVEIHNADALGVLATGDVYSAQRRLFGIPAPLLPGTLPQRSFAVLMMLPGEGQAGLRVPPPSHHWPQSYYFRVSAFDYEGRMVNWVNDYVHTHATDAGTNIETYEPMGGAVEVLDPYPDLVNPLSLPPILTSEQAYTLLLSKLGSRPVQSISALGGSAASVTAALGAGHAGAMGTFSNASIFSAQATQQRLQSIRQMMDAHSSALQAGPSRVLGSVRPEGSH